MSMFNKSWLIASAMLIATPVVAQDAALGALLPQAIDGDEAVPVTITGTVGTPVADLSECTVGSADGAIAFNFGGDWTEEAGPAFGFSPAFHISADSDDDMTLTCAGEGTIGIRFATDGIVVRSLMGLATAPDGDAMSGRLEARYGSIAVAIGNGYGGNPEALDDTSPNYITDSLSAGGYQALVGLYIGADCTATSGTCETSGTSNLNRRLVTLDGPSPSGTVTVSGELYAGAPYSGDIVAVSPSPAIFAIFDNGLANLILPLPAGFGAPGLPEGFPGS